jgi:integral membrane sensor domain MASE1
VLLSLFWILAVSSRIWPAALLWWLTASIVALAAIPAVLLPCCSGLRDGETRSAFFLSLSCLGALVLEGIALKYIPFPPFCC